MPSQESDARTGATILHQPTLAQVPQPAGKRTCSRITGELVHSHRRARTGLRIGGSYARARIDPLPLDHIAGQNRRQGRRGCQTYLPATSVADDGYHSGGRTRRMDASSQASAPGTACRAPTEATAVGRGCQAPAMNERAGTGFLAWGRGDWI